MKRKVLALVLAIVMVCSLLPTVALATVSEGDVAKIGDNGYSSFKAAMDSVQDGQTVEVLKSSTLNGMITFKKNCTVDIKEGVTVTIGTNSLIDSYSMKNVEFVGKGGISVGSGPYDAVFELGNGDGVKLNLRDGVYQGKYIAECKGTGECYVNIYGGYYNFDTALAHKNQDYYTLDVAVYGGYFTRDVSDYCAPTVKCVLLATTDPAYALGYRYTTAPVTADEAACVIMGADGGRTYCLNVSGAFAAAKSGDTIQLLAVYSHSIDLATAGAFILNLGGFELTADAGCDAIIIREGIDLTVLNGTVSAPGANAFILTQNDDGMGGWLAEYYPDVTSTLTLDKVTVTAGTGVMLDNDNSDALVAFKSGIVTGTSAAFAKTDRNAGGFSFVGGTFNTEPAEADVATASTKVDNGDGTWTVKPPVAQITKDSVTTKYATLAEAIADATGGTAEAPVVIKVLANTTAPATITANNVKITADGDTKPVITGLTQIGSTSQNLVFENLEFQQTGTLNINGTNTKLLNCNIFKKAGSFSGDNLSTISGTNTWIEGCAFQGTSSSSKQLAPVYGTDVTIKNSTFDKGWGAMYYSTAKGTWTIDGCTFTNIGCYCIHTGECPADVVVKNTKIDGWCSFGSSVKSLSFDNCTFDKTEGASYSIIRPYVDATLTNCKFTERFVAWTDTTYGDGIAPYVANAEKLEEGAIVTAPTVAALSGCQVIQADGVKSTNYTAVDAANPEDGGIVAIDTVKDATGKYTKGTFVLGNHVSTGAITCADGYITKKLAENTYEVIKQTTKVDPVPTTPVKGEIELPSDVPADKQEAVKAEVQQQTQTEISNIVSIPEVTTMTPAETKVEQAIVTSGANAGKITTEIDNLTPTVVVNGEVQAAQPAQVEQNDTLESIVKRAVVANVTEITTDNVDDHVTDGNISKFVKVAVDSAAVEVKTSAGTSSEVTVQTTVDSVIYNVKPMATTTVTVGTGDAAVTTTVTTPIPNELITSPITFRLGVPSHFTGIVKVTHTHSDGTTEEFNVPVLTGDNGKKYVELSSDNFSEWEVSMGSTTVTTNEVKKLNTSSLTGNIDMTLENGGTLLLQGDNLGNVTVQPKNGVLVTFDYDGGADADGALKMFTVIDAGTQVTPPVLQKHGDQYFSGWTSDKQPVGEKIWEDTTFTAQWTANETYTVELKADAPTTGIRIGEGTNVTVKVSGADWNDATIVVDYDAAHFTLSNTHDSTVVNNTPTAGKATITLYGKDRVAGEVCKTLTFVGNTAHETAPTTDNFNVTSATVNTGTSAMVIDVTSATGTGAKVKVIEADAQIYTISLGNGLSYLTDEHGAIQATVEKGSNFTGKINDYDKGYTYTFTDGDTTLTGITPAADGKFTIANVTGNMTVTVEKTITGIDKPTGGNTGDVKVIPDYVGGYSLVLVDATNATAQNLAYNGAVMFKADKFGTLFDPDATSVYAYIVKGTVTEAEAYKQLSVSKADKIVIATDDENNNTSCRGKARDVNDTGTFDLNDVQAVWNCYNVNQAKYPMATYMAVYLRADVDASGKVDSTDVSAIFGVYKNPETLLLGATSGD